MDKEFSFIKDDKSPQEIKAESVDQILYQDFAKKDLPIVEEKQSGYEDPRWIEKSNSIKARDNYTCQLCHTFNPMQGGLMYIQQGEYETYHQYMPPSSYQIHVREFDFTINFDLLSGYHITMPRLNVHHKIYYRNRNLWDYQDDCLVTLCDKCHHYIHSLNNIGIPIVEEDSNGNPLLIGYTQPKPYQPQIDHTDLSTFKPLSIVKENLWGINLKGKDAIDFKKAKSENKKWYDYQEILDQYVVRITTFKSYDPRWNKHTPDEIKKVAEFVILDFVENILGYTKKK